MAPDGFIYYMSIIIGMTKLAILLCQIIICTLKMCIVYKRFETNAV